MAWVTSRDLARLIAAAYGADLAAWAKGPARVYDRLAEVLVAASPVSLGGAVVLDLGAGTGAVSRAVEATGGRVVAVDLALDMLRFDQRHRPLAVAADARALPFPAGTFDAVVAGFSISHVPDPSQALSEAARVIRRGGVLLVNVFSARSSHPAKEQIEQVAARFGYRRPAWYEWFKTEVEPLTALPEALAAAPELLDWKTWTSSNARFISACTPPPTWSLGGWEWPPWPAS